MIYMRAVEVAITAEKINAGYVFFVDIFIYLWIIKESIILFKYAKINKTISQWYEIIKKKNQPTMIK